MGSVEAVPKPRLPRRGCADGCRLVSHDNDARALLRQATAAANQVSREKSRHSLLCRVNWHAWTRWKMVESGPLTSNSVRIGTYYIHNRECTRCGRFEAHMAKAP